MSYLKKVYKITHLNINLEDKLSLKVLYGTFN